MSYFKINPYFVVIFLVLSLTSCSESDNSDNNDEATEGSVVIVELVDPTPGEGDQFGAYTVVLGNGNIVVLDPNDSSVASNNGAIHLYNSDTQILIASFYGDNVDDRLGSHGITALPNNNFLIATAFDDVSGIVDAGSVILVDGDSGAKIGNSIVGNANGDIIGLNPVAILPNGNFVVAAPFDGVDGLLSAGSVRLIDGSTGNEIGSPIVGIVAGDQVGNNKTIVLPNNNYIFNLGIVSDGSRLVLVNGETGNIVKKFNFIGTVTPLSNNNFVIAWRFEDVGVIQRAGSVRLMNGVTGMQIGNVIVGDDVDDNLGLNGITVLANNNFVIASSLDSVNGIFNAGSVMLVDGVTGMPVGNMIAGDNVNDNLGTSVIALANNNFVIASELDDGLGVVDAGSVILVDGVTGLRLGAAMVGDSDNDQIGKGVVAALTGGNYVIASPFDDEGGVFDAGSVRLMDGLTGIQIGNTMSGDIANDNLGEDGIIPLTNNNFVISTVHERENGIGNVGSVRLVDGSSGIQIGNTISGDTANDKLGLDGITVLGNNNFVVASSGDDENGMKDIGSARLVDGGTGIQIGETIVGGVADDFIGAIISETIGGDFYILSLGLANNSGKKDSGLVRLIAQ